MTSKAVRRCLVRRVHNRAFAGVSTSINLGSLVVKGVGPWSDTIEWGDNQVSAYSPAGSGPLSLAHTYAAPGTYTIKETLSEYAGDTISASFSIKVTVASTTTALAASPASAVYGQTVVFSATVTGQGVATGSVAFFVGLVNAADLLGRGTLALVGGHDVATFSTSTLAVSRTPYSITAVYAGDSDNVGSTSNVVSETIGLAATTTVASTSTNSSDFGQSITLTAAVSPKAPGSGTPTGSVDFYDTTTATDLGSVSLSASGRASKTISSLPVGTQTITETYSGDGNFLSSVGTLSETILVSVYVLNAQSPSPSITGTVYLSGSSSINIPGQLVVDSPAKPAVTLSGSSKIIASGGVDVVGTVSLSGSASITPSATTGIAAVADPLAGLAVPSLTGTAVAVKLASGSQTINPGIYRQITVSGSASLKLNPGVYVISGGGLSVSGSASISGAGVMIYNAGSAYPASGGTYGGMTLSGSGNVNLSAPATGTYAGILFFQARTNPTLFSLTGSSATNLTGSIYAADALFSESGSSSAMIDGAMVVNRIQLSGSAVVGAAQARSFRSQPPLAPLRQRRRSRLSEL